MPRILLLYRSNGTEVCFANASVVSSNEKCIAHGGRRDEQMTSVSTNFRWAFMLYAIKT